MKVHVTDVEGDGLRPTKFHVLSYHDEGEINSLVTHKDMIEFLSDKDMTLVMHNGGLWDIPQLERVLKIKIKARVIDTLFLSWYLFPNRTKHGLESWGEFFGVPKPEIDDWENLALEEYVHRCQEDVTINTKLWDLCIKTLSVLYGVSPDKVIDLPILKYLEFKLQCAQEQQRSRWKLDKDLALATLAKLYPARDERVQGLSEAMPKVAKYAVRTPPANPYKKDGTLSVHGVKWKQLLRENNLPEGHTDPVKVVVSYEEPNPKSHSQLKDWLFSLGWEPATFKYVKEEDGTQRAIPQIQTEDEDRNKLLCPSVILLAEKEPALEHLKGLFVMNHRISLIEGFLNNVDEDGFVTAEIQGLTNTLRFKHKTIVNLPGVDKPWGKEIRGCLIARDGYELCGSDIIALENNTGDHYIYDYDPKYVEEKSDPEYDPHIEMCVIAGLVTQAEADFYKWYKKKK